MSLRVYNSLSREKELFESTRPGKVGIYLCGPTVYKSPHIGHMVGPLIFDAIKRYLQYKNFDVTWVVNITDVEDKLIDASQRTGEPITALAARYTAEYKQCLSLLGIDAIDHFPHASEHIPEIIDLIARLIARGHAYAADGNVYFDVQSDPRYGRLSHRTPDQQEAGLRTVEAAGKRNAADFALWKAAKPGEPSWQSPWGPGRPGWHIECSAMSMKYLGETFDFHGGGLDLLFPHHENELAQSECATGKPFARFWLHNGLTRIRTKLPGGQWADEKMSGSLGNVVPARQLIERHGADVLRYLVLSTHYRRPIEFNDDVLANAKKAYAVFTRVFERAERILGAAIDVKSPEMDRLASELAGTDAGPYATAVITHKMKFLEMMDDDFNTAGALAVMHELSGDINAFIERAQLEKQKQPQAAEALAAGAVTLKRLGAILGLFRVAAPAGAADSSLADQLVGVLIALRNDARKEKNFPLADRIRKDLEQAGITLDDRPDGTVWRKT